MALEVGTQVNPRVKLVRLLGRGGMGSVWVGAHTTLDAEVAVKFVSSALDVSDRGTLARFRREATVAAKLKSPHVVKTFDHGVMDDDTPYIVMELLEGESLGARLQRSGTLSLTQTALLLGQVAQVLDEAHGRGVVHRDIKPDNLFLVESPYELFVKVLDFGIAKETLAPTLEGATSTGTIVGTPEYMSPERLLSNEPANAYADLWALAVVAYQAITGRLPFAGDTVTSLCISICKGGFELPSEVRPELPTELDGWFQQAMHIDSKQRFANGQEMADALGEVVDALDADIAGAPVERARRKSGGSGSGPRILPLKGDSSDGDAPTEAVSSGAVRVTPPGGYAVDPHDGTADTMIADSGDDSPAKSPAPKISEGSARPATFSGAAANFEPTEQELHKWSVAKIAAIAVVGLVLAGGAKLLLQAESAPAGALGAGGASGGGGAATPTELTTSGPEPDSSGSTAPEASASETDTTDSGETASASTPPTSTTRPRTPTARPTGRPKPTATKPASTATAAPSRPGCEQPFYVDSKGIEHIKPECLR